MLWSFSFFPWVPFVACTNPFLSLISFYCLHWSFFFFFKLLLLPTLVLFFFSPWAPFVACTSPFLSLSSSYYLHWSFFFSFKLLLLLTLVLLSLFSNLSYYLLAFSFFLYFLKLEFKFHLLSIMVFFASSLNSSYSNLFFSPRAPLAMCFGPSFFLLELLLFWSFSPPPPPTPITPPFLIFLGIIRVCNVITLL